MSDELQYTDMTRTKLIIWKDEYLQSLIDEWRAYTIALCAASATVSAIVCISVMYVLMKSNERPIVLDTSSVERKINMQEMLKQKAEIDKQIFALTAKKDRIARAVEKNEEKIEALKRLATITKIEREVSYSKPQTDSEFSREANRVFWDLGMKHMRIEDR